jgi:Xaa-Pro aminopeptidase
MDVREKLRSLRKLMTEKGIDAYIIPGTDPHMSEYLADRYKTREFISGFTGSAGTVVVTRDKAGLWTDSRYYLQAADQLEGSGIELFKSGLPGVPSHTAWIASELAASGKGYDSDRSVAGYDRSVGYDGMTLSEGDIRDLEKVLSPKGIGLSDAGDLLDPFWERRPSLPDFPVYEHGTGYAGESRGEKLARMREEMARRDIDYHLIASLDDIAWLLNLRGSDVSYNPLFYAYLVAGRSEVLLFIDRKKVKDPLASLLEAEGIRILPYAEVFPFVKALDTLVPARSGRLRLSLNPDRVCAALYSAIPASIRIVDAVSPVTLFKAVKNESQIRCLKNAMKKDGAALVRFLIWLEDALRDTDLPVTERTVQERLKEFRAEQPDFVGESFTTIAGFNHHGAIVHYAVTDETDIPISGDGLLLIDSGAHYLDGTTDITRVVICGKARKEQIRDYTLVLKGHIALASAVFPEGTRGYQLDAFARLPLWREGLSYGHGTGHGIGFFLNVHEGPQSISVHPRDVAIEPGMVTSDEPGVYREGGYGIRIENLILSYEKEETSFGRFFAFETLTLCPYERRLIDPLLLSSQERDWVNSYHLRVYQELSPFLSEAERKWLQEKTSAV